ncbi:ATP-grasp domain-containing protein [Pelistega europaea]|uniref:ATP-grasp domain-containing protein n=1 Tax=Pelistega europaea TaxID=106147 RepID=A0A7Y4LA63_9BURK|nr:ATP-grasp domain-containing protein [Pelistega europaea]NOL49840.1 ATP-grasp domain-containing protein [Pelistega europaea]
MKGIIVDGYSTGYHLAKYLLKNGCELMHIQSTKDVPALWKAKFDPSLYSKNIIYSEQAHADIKAYHPDFIVAGSELGVALSEKLSFAFGLKGNHPHSTGLRRNKHQMMNAVKEAGLASIAEFAVSPHQTLPAIPQDWYPVVVKPTESAGGDGVVICHSLQEVEKAIQHNFSSTNVFGLDNQQILIQRKISGQQLMVNTISVEGQHIILEVWQETRKIIDDKYTVYDFEVLVNDYETAFSGLSAYIQGLLSALQVQYGPCHIELFWTDSGPVLIEMAARLQGGIDGKVSESALGYSHISAFAHLIINNDIPPALSNTHQKQKSILLINLIFNNAGTIVSSHFDQLVGGLTSFHSSIGIPKVGDKVPRTTNLATKVGHFYLVGDDIEQLMSDYYQVRQWEAESQLFELA